MTDSVSLFMHFTGETNEIYFGALSLWLLLQGKCWESDPQALLRPVTNQDLHWWRGEPKWGWTLSSHPWWASGFHTYSSIPGNLIHPTWVFFVFYIFPLSNQNIWNISLAGSAFTASDNLSLSSWVTTTSGFSGFQHPQSLSAMSASASLPHPIQGSLPPYSRLGMPLTPTALAGTMQGSGPSFPSFHMPRYHHYFQQGPYAAIQGLRHSSTVMTPFVWLHFVEDIKPVLKVTFSQRLITSHSVSVCK